MARKVLSGLIQASNPINDETQLGRRDPGGDAREAPADDRRGRQEGRPDPLPAGDLQRPVLLPRRRTSAGTTPPSRCPARPSRSCAPIAKKYKMAMVVPVYEREMAGVYYNTAAVIDADGSYLGKYRKNHIPQTSGFWEKYFFKPGQPRLPGVQDPATRRSACTSATTATSPRARARSACTAPRSSTTRRRRSPASRSTCGSSSSPRTRWRTATSSARSTASAPRRRGTSASSTALVLRRPARPDPRVRQRGQGRAGRRELDLDVIEEVRRTWQFFRDRRPDSYGTWSRIVSARRDRRSRPSSRPATCVTATSMAVAGERVDQDVARTDVEHARSRRDGTGASTARSRQPYRRPT